MIASIRRAHIDNAGFISANFRDVLDHADWWTANRDRFEWHLIERKPSPEMLDMLAGGVLLRNRDVWVLGCWTYGAWHRMTEGAAWPLGNWQPTERAEPDLESFRMLMRE